MNCTLIAQIAQIELADWLNGVIIKKMNAIGKTSATKELQTLVEKKILK